MNDKKYIWQRNFAAFAGPGIDHPSDMMRVVESEARDILASLVGLDWQPPAYVGEDRHGGYTVVNATNACATALFLAGTIVGFYAGSNLWIARPHRRRGLSTPIILGAATQRGGTILPAGVVVQGYTATGIAAHRTAHSHAVLTALAEGRPVPAAVVDDLPPDEARFVPNGRPLPTVS